MGDDWGWVDNRGWAKAKRVLRYRVGIRKRAVVGTTEDGRWDGLQEGSVVEIGVMECGWDLRKGVRWIWVAGGVRQGVVTMVTGWVVITGHVEDRSMDKKGNTPIDRGIVRLLYQLM
ncbi:hypothetical protein MRB53_002225 [Persea americana]|uniref:Uncharacterized protein n=1 Tax=Persea americana TaxID=3435 RepID=A0ACC2MW78_PERAE|nr:hypothetical protein MRB53_002225 [Persea americana]